MTALRSVLRVLTYYLYAALLERSAPCPHGSDCATGCRCV